MEINLELWIAVISIGILLYKWITRNNDYFHEKPIPSMAVKPFFGGIAPLVFKSFSMNGFISHIYQKYPNVK